MEQGMPPRVPPEREPAAPSPPGTQPESGSETEAPRS
jgi:hypothetical protein